MTTAERAVTRLAVRQTWRAALAVALVVAGMSGLVAVQYQTTFAGALDGDSLSALAANPAIRILFGPPLALDDPGGFTVWRTGTPVQVVVAVWALLTAIRITRGEEDTGRTDLLLAGRLRLTDLTTRSLAAVSAGAVLAGAAVAAALLVTGTQPAGALIHGAGVLGTALTFTAAAALAAQVLPTRAAAVGATIAFLGAALLARMLADGIDRLSWLSWLTPFGLAARTAPYADNRPGPLLLLAAAPALLTAATLVAARHRDPGDGLVTIPVTRRPRTRLLGSLTGFAVRRALRPTAGWAIGIGAYFLFVGALTGTVLDFLGDNPRFADLAATAGFAHLDTADGFTAAMVALLAIPAGLYAATRVAVMAEDETHRRWTGLLALPLTRTRVAVTETAVAAAGVVLLLTTAALTLAGAAPVDLGSAFAAAMNVAPVAALSLGAAVLALGWAPRTVALVGALPTAGAFLLGVVAESTGAPDWVANLSPFNHLAPVPVVPPAWPATAVLVATSLLLAAVGVVGYARRDLLT